jgi:hypothetical protein
MEALTYQRMPRSTFFFVLLGLDNLSHAMYCYKVQLEGPGCRYGHHFSSSTMEVLDFFGYSI